MVKEWSLTSVSHGNWEAGVQERKWNSMCSGEMRRYMEEHQWRRRLSGLKTDAEARKRGEQIGLDTLVVHAVNDGY